MLIIFITFSANQCTGEREDVGSITMMLVPLATWSASAKNACTLMMAAVPLGSPMRHRFLAAIEPFRVPRCAVACTFELVSSSSSTSGCNAIRAKPATDNMA